MAAQSKGEKVAGRGGVGRPPPHGHEDSAAEHKNWPLEQIQPPDLGNAKATNSEKERGGGGRRGLGKVESEVASLPPSLLLVGPPAGSSGGGRGAARVCGEALGEGRESRSSRSAGRCGG